MVAHRLVAADDTVAHAAVADNAAVGFAANRVAHSEQRLARLLQEAHQAHSLVDRLTVQERVEEAEDVAFHWPRVPSSGPSPPAREEIQALKDRVSKIGSSSSSGSMLHTALLSPPPPAPVLKSEALATPATTSATRRAVEEYATRRAASRAESARHSGRTSERRSQRLMIEHAEARATIIELEAENASLRASLDRMRDEGARAAETRAELVQSRHRVEVLESQARLAAPRLEALRAELAEANAEKERLRTLLAGTVWFEALA